MNNKLFTDEECKILIQECITPLKTLTKNDLEKREKEHDPNMCDTINRLHELRKETLERLKVYNKKTGLYDIVVANHSEKGKSSLFLQESESVSDIENYELAAKDDFQDWVIHHRLETRGFGYTSEELISLGLYFKRPASELIYLKTTVHSQLHADYRKTAKQIRDNFTQCIKLNYFPELC